MSWPLRIATLSKGVGVPPLPEGFLFITDSDGAFLRDVDGAFLVEAI